MTPWLNIYGAGLVYSLPHVAEHSAASLPRVAPQAEDFIQPDLQELPELLSVWRQKPCPPLRRIPLYARMGLLAALRALQQSGWQKEDHDDAQRAEQKGQTALILGTAHSGIVMSMDFMDSILDAEPRLSSPTAFSHAVNNMGAGLMSLLLDVRGPCQTLSQFELSFAGAVQTAAYLLHSGRVDRALVGAMDECDARFSACCSTVMSAAQGAVAPTAQGAVFFCMEKSEHQSQKNPNAQGSIRISFGEEPQDREAQTHLLLSGAATALQNTQGKQGENLSMYYGSSMLAQALDVYLALKAGGSSLCFCRETSQQRSALVEVRA